MIRLNVINMEGFLQTVNECTGAVYVVHPDGRKENINNQSGVQWDLQNRHRQNKNYSQLILDIPTAKDYMKIVCFTPGDC